VREFGQELPMASRIIKVANAYDDLIGPEGTRDDRAMERIHLGLGYEYDPRVVDSLSRVLERRRRAAPSGSA
jgi:HD-GYP domain-containing protein (c-di-GMP phosphodiesterase class II)